MKNYTTLLICPTEEPQGGIYRHQGKGGQGANPDPKYERGCARMATEMRLWPRFHGHSMACARGRLSRVVLSPPCQLHAPVLGFRSLILTE